MKGFKDFFRCSNYFSEMVLRRDSISKAEFQVVVLLNSLVEGSIK